MGRESSSVEMEAAGLSRRGSSSINRAVYAPRQGSTSIVSQWQIHKVTFPQEEGQDVYFVSFLCPSSFPAKPYEEQAQEEWESLVTSRYPLMNSPREEWN